MISVIKLEFAKSITLGHSIGAVLAESSFTAMVVQVAESVLSPEYQKWAAPVVGYLVRMAAMSFTWFLHRFMSAFHSAIRGGFLFTRNLRDYLVSMGHMQPTEYDIDEIGGYTIALLGLIFQFYCGFSLPFPLSAILFPFTCLEYFLGFFASTSTAVVT
ncbi:MAG: hypothetical protein Q8P67_02800 [archaeon]|nr:hypothetical protein [archaeon]